MAGDKDLRISLEAVDKTFSKTIKQAKKNLLGLGKQSEQTSKRLQNIGRSFSQVGRRMVGSLSSIQGMLVGGGLIYALQRGASAAMEFRTGLANIGTLLDGEVAPTLKRFEKDLQRMVLSSSKSLNDLTKALYQTISAGITDPDEASKLVDIAQKAAVAGLSDTSVAVDAMTTLVNSFGLEMSEAQLAADLLFMTVKKGRTTFEQLATPLGRVATIAAQAGVNMEELFAAISTLTKAGLTTEEAITQLRQFFLSIINPAEEAKQLYKDLGISFGKSALEGGKFTETLRRMHTETQGNAEVLTKLTPNIRAMVGAMVLAGEQIETYNLDLGHMKDATGAMSDAFALIAETPTEKFNIALQRVSETMRRLGEELLPSVIGALDSLGTWLENNEGGLKAAFQGILWTVKEVASTVDMAIRGLSYLATLGLAYQEEERARQWAEHKRQREAYAKQIGGMIMTPGEASQEMRFSGKAGLGRVKQEIALAQSLLVDLEKKFTQFQDNVKLSDIYLAGAQAAKERIKELSGIYEKYRQIEAKKDKQARQDKVREDKIAAKRAAEAELKARETAYRRAMAKMERDLHRAMDPTEKALADYFDLQAIVDENKEGIETLARWWKAKLQEMGQAAVDEWLKLQDKLHKAAEGGRKEAMERLKGTEGTGGGEVSEFQSGEAWLRAMAQKLGIPVDQIKQQLQQGAGAPTVGEEWAAAGLGFLGGAVSPGEMAAKGAGQAFGAMGMEGPIKDALEGLVGQLAGLRPDEFKAMLSEQMLKLSQVLENFIANLGNVVEVILSNLPATIYKAIRGAFKAAINLPGNIWDGITGFFGSIFHEGGVVPRVPNIGGKVIDLDDARHRLQKFHSGRKVRIKADEVPSLLQAGEGVVNRVGMSLLGEQGLNRLNAGSMPQAAAAGGGGDTFVLSPAVIAADDVDRWFARMAADAMNARSGNRAAVAARTRAGRVPGKTGHRRR